MPQRTCTATRKDGQPCTAPVLKPDASVCFAHDATLQAQRAEARVRGGRGKGHAVRAAKVLPATLRPVLSLLLDALDQTHRGELDPKVSTALAALAGAIVRTYQAGAVEERLADLETQIARLSSRRPA